MKQWTQDFDRQITVNQQNQHAKQAAYEQMGASIGATIGAYLGEIEARKEREKVYKRTREINREIDRVYDQLYSDVDYWVDFQNRLIELGNEHKSIIPKKAIESLDQSINAIQYNLKDIDEQIAQLDKDVEYEWEVAQEMNDVFRFPLREFKSMSFKKTNPNIGYMLVNMVTSGASIPNVQSKISYLDDASTLLAKYSVDFQNYEIIVSAEPYFTAGGGTNSRFKSLASSAKAIKVYLALKNKIQDEYNAFENDLKKRKGQVIIKNTNPLIRLVDVGVLANSDFTRTSELNSAYASLNAQIGEFGSHYSRLAPNKIADLSAEGYIIEHGTATLTLSQTYMEPSPLHVSIPIDPGQEKTIDLASYGDQFRVNKLFHGFGVDLKEEKFKLSKSLFPKPSNRTFPNNYKFNLAYSTYNFGIPEFSTTILGSKMYKGMASYNRHKLAFFTNVDFGRIFYGKGKITTGIEDISGDLYQREITDFSYFGGDLAIGGIGLAKGLLKGSAMLEIQTAATLLNFRNFDAKATEESKLGNIEQTAAGNYKYLVYNLASGHAKAALITRIGSAFIHVEYALNFYPKGISDNELGENGDISALSEDYQEDYTKFFEDIHNNYFNNSLTISLLF